jgi:3-oxoacyl-[acyl-carrier-protein] synthase-3
MNDKINNVYIKSILSLVPSTKFDIKKKNKQNERLARVCRVTGVKESYKSKKNQTTVNLFCEAAEKIIDKNRLSKSKINLLICVTQTPDYLMPSCSNIVHQKINLNSQCAAFDINLGCSGYVYGLWVAMNLMKKFKNNENALLLAGDTISKTIAKTDIENKLLFGDGVSATLLGIKKNQTTYFEIGSANEGCNKLFINNSGLKKIGNKIPTFYMDGKEVFHFALKNVPMMIINLLKKIKNNNVNFYVFHQANFFMLEKIFELLNIKKNQRIYSIQNYGNTSSASIPISICSKLKNQKKNIIMAGFGSGFSFAACFLNLSNCNILSVYKSEK